MDSQYTGRKISELRKEKGWTQKDIAEKLHVSIAAVSKWERGLNYPDLSLMEPLAQLLEISVSELLGLENKPTDLVIHNITEISVNEKDASTQKFQKKAYLIFITIIIFFVLAWSTLIVGQNNDFILTLLRYNNFVGYDLLAIGLGVVAWGMAGVSILSQHPYRWKSYTILSFLCCAVSLYIPILITDFTFRFELYGTIEDIIWGYHFAAIVLLLGTVLFNTCAWWVHRKN